MAGSPLGGTPAIPLSAHQAATEAAILQALPHDLVHVLCGALLQHLSGPATYERHCLQAAHDALDAGACDTAAALGYLRAGLARAIRPDGITPRPETVLLQAAFWLLQHEAQGAELIGNVATTSASRSHTGGAA
ncbi:MAG: hypothetical protein AB9M60_00695 [Leptothrix sp. (in: b-proteobacteria)]